MNFEDPAQEAPRDTSDTSGFIEINQEQWEGERIGDLL